MNKPSTRGHTILLLPSGKETLVPSGGLFHIFGSGPLFFQINLIFLGIQLQQLRNYVNMQTTGHFFHALQCHTPFLSIDVTFM